MIATAHLDAEEERAERLARHLRVRGRRQGATVALPPPRSTDAYIALPPIGNTFMEDGERMEDLSRLPSGEWIPRDEPWAGSLARRVAGTASTTEPPPPGRSPLNHAFDEGGSTASEYELGRPAGRSKE